MFARLLFAGLVVAPQPSIATSRMADVDTGERDEDVDALERDAANDTGDDPERVAAGARRLAGRLARMSPFDATRIAATAALSASVRVRQTIAEALTSPFRLVGDDFVLGELAHDSDLDVRGAALRACAARGLAKRCGA